MKSFHRERALFKDECGPSKPVRLSLDSCKMRCFKRSQWICSRSAPIDPPKAHQDTGKTEPLSPNRSKNWDYYTLFYSFQPWNGWIRTAKGKDKAAWQECLRVFNHTPRKVLRGAERLQQLHLWLHSKHRTAGLLECQNENRNYWWFFKFVTTKLKVYIYQHQEIQKCQNMPQKQQAKKAILIVIYLTCCFKA